MPTVNYIPEYKGCGNSASFPRKQYVNNGITTAKYSMPQKFNGADGGTSFSLGRSIYSKSIHTENDLLALEQIYNSGNKKNINYLNGKPISYQSADQHIQRKKNIAIGRASMPSTETTGTTSELSFKPQYNANRNTINTALRKCRNGGTVPPKKAAHKPYR